MAEAPGAGAEPEASAAKAPDGGDIGERLEEARQRLRQTIPPPQDADADERKA